MKTAKDIALIGMYTALLIGAQFVLSYVSGVEIVTVLFAPFCYKYGFKKGLILSISFSLIRCLIFGFIIDVVILYLIYYPLLCLVFSSLGKVFKSNYTIINLFIIIVASACMTAIFTLLSDVITPLLYGYTLKAWQAYFIASLPVMTTQCIIVAITFVLFFVPIQKLLNLIKF